MQRMVVVWSKSKTDCPPEHHREPNPNELSQLLRPGVKPKELVGAGVHIVDGWLLARVMSKHPQQFFLERPSLVAVRPSIEEHRPKQVGRHLLKHADKIFNAQFCPSIMWIV